MSLVKSFSVGNGDMFYIRHNSDNFTIIDCCIPGSRMAEMLYDIDIARADKGIERFISTHPDQDHISGIVALDNRIEILNFYVVDNNASKSEESVDFLRYKALRDHARKAFCISQACSRLWMNRSNESRQTSGIEVLWPVLTDPHFIAALVVAELGGSPNNISPVIRYSLGSGASFMWMGDLETDFMQSISSVFTPQKTDVLFAPHHGRRSGRVPSAWLQTIDPKIIVVGEAPSEDLYYYSGYNTITQNSSGDISFECLSGKTHVYVASASYSVDFLRWEWGMQSSSIGTYIGTFDS